MAGGGSELTYTYNQPISGVSNSAARTLGRLRRRVGDSRIRALASVPRRTGYSSTRGLRFDDAELESRLVWILGSPRTGSTWLLEQLCHPARIDHSGSLGLSVPPGGAAPIDALPINEFLVSRHIAPALGEPVEREGSLVPATLNNYLGHKSSYLFARDYAEVWRPQLRRLVLVRLQGTLDRARQRGLPVGRAPLLIIKEVNGSHAADVVMSLFPRSRLLFLARDGRDVVDSMRDAVGGDAWLGSQQHAESRFANPAERLAWVRRASLDWTCDVAATSRAYDAHTPSLRRIVRYEDLLADTAGALRGIFGWLGLPREDGQIAETVAAHDFAEIPADMRGPGRKWRAATPGLWRENLSPEEQLATAEIMGPRLAELGYGT